MIKEHNKLTILSSLIQFVRFHSLALIYLCVHTHTRVYFIMVCCIHMLLQSYIEHEEKFTHPFTIIIFCFYACLLLSARTHTHSYIHTFIHVPFFYCYCYSLLYSEFEPCPALCLVHKVNNRKDWTRKRKEQVKYCYTDICRLFKCKWKIDQINVQSLKVRILSFSHFRQKIFLFIDRE